VSFHPQYLTSGIGHDAVVAAGLSLALCHFEVGVDGPDRGNPASGDRTGRKVISIVAWPTKVWIAFALKPRIGRTGRSCAR
jgi:hypothetical protein